MDHSVQMGVECVERLLHGRTEDCWNDRILPKEKQDLGLLPEGSAGASPPAMRNLETAALPA